MRQLIKIFKCIRRHAIVSLFTDSIIDFFVKAFNRAKKTQSNVIA